MRVGRTEADEQKAVLQWCVLMEGRWSELEYLYHVPNGGSRNAKEAANLKAQGVRAGVPDLELPAARGVYTGLHIEMKHGKNRVSKEQDRFLMALKEMEYQTMTKQTLERLIEMQKAIAVCECIINDIVEGYKLQLATPRTEEEVPDFMREDLKNMLAVLLESYQADFEKI